MKRTVFWVLILSLVLSGCSSVQEKYEADAFFMDTPVSLTVYHENGQEIVSSSLEKIREVEEQYSVYKPDSYVSRINEAAGDHSVELPEDVYLFLERLYNLCEETDGVFDLTIGPLSQLWNVTAPDARVPSEKGIAAATSLVSYSDLILEDSKAYLCRPGQMIDLGGAAKGLAAQLIYNELKDQQTSGLLSLGGSIAAYGTKPDGSLFTIGLRNPFEEAGSYYATLKFSNGFISTSGSYERYFEQDGVVYHHILDTKTGYPVSSQWMSVSVVGKDGVLCDVLSTCFYAYTWEEILAACIQYEVEVIAVDTGKNVYRTSDAPELELTDSSFREVDQ